MVSISTNGFCSYPTHKGPRELPPERFGKYKSGKLRAICRLCDSAKQAEYKQRMLSNPETALRFKTSQARYADEYRKRPENVERMRAHRKNWYEKNKNGEAVKRSRAEYVARYPDRLKAVQKRYREKVKADPVKHQEFLESRRIQYRLRREKQGEALEVSKKFPLRFAERETRVPVGPFRTWLLLVVKEREMTIAQVARAAGLDSSGLERIAYGEYKVTTLVTVDKVITAMSGPPLRSLYPDA